MNTKAIDYIAETSPSIRKHIEACDATIEATWLRYREAYTNGAHPNRLKDFIRDIQGSCQNMLHYCGDAVSDLDTRGL